MENLKRNIQKLLTCEYPIYGIFTDNIEERDGLVFADEKILDDKNVKEKTLGLRRLKTPQKNLYKLKHIKQDIQETIHSNSKYYIDSLGSIFYYEKAIWCSLQYHKILKIQRRGSLSVLTLAGINFKATVNRPPQRGYTWAGILYAESNPWLLYDYAEEKLDNTRRKI